MRIFSLLGLLIVVVIIAWLTATYMGSMGGAGTVPPQTVQIESPGPAPSEAPAVRNVPIDKARQLVDQDKERQKRMQEAIEQQ